MIDVAVMPRTCGNCGAAVTDQFCSHCGQRQRELDASVWGLLREWLEEVFGLEGRTFRTLKPLLVRPGAVTADYLAGRRRTYTPPLRLFFAATSAFFLAFLLTRSLSARYYGYDSTNIDGYVDAMTTILILLVPVVALVLKLMYVMAHRPLMHHVVFTLHTSTAAVLWFLVLILIAAALRSVWGNHAAAPDWLPDFVFWLYLPGMVLLLAYVALALRRVYASGWAGAVARTLGIVMVLAAAFFVAVPRLLILLG